MHKTLTALATLLALSPAFASAQTLTRAQGELLLEAHAPSNSLTRVDSARALFAGALRLENLRLAAIGDIAPVPGWTTPLAMKLKFDFNAPAAGRYAFGVQFFEPFAHGWKVGACAASIAIGNAQPKMVRLAEFDEAPVFAEGFELAAGQNPAEIFIACQRDRFSIVSIKPRGAGGNIENPIRIVMREPRGTSRVLRSADVSIEKAEGAAAAAAASATPAVRVLRPGAARRDAAAPTLAENVAGGWNIEYRALKPQDFKKTADVEKHLLADATNALTIPSGGASLRQISGAPATYAAIYSFETNLLTTTATRESTLIAVVYEETSVSAAFCASRLRVGDRDLTQLAHAEWSWNPRSMVERGHGLAGLWEIPPTAAGAYQIKGDVFCVHSMAESANPAIKFFIKRPGEPALRPATAADFAIEKPKN
ncbi:MAG: hypothetical protein ING19_02815 [Azospirillum sp.]|nr:hypothetical protein [Azospirillum sp.]MCA3264977.1 hypothetical protein [Azospirillum sp.]